MDAGKWPPSCPGKMPYMEGVRMPRMTDTMLDGGDPFPQMTLPQVGGGQVHLPDDLAGNWGVVLLYRGHW